MVILNRMMKSKADLAVYHHADKSAHIVTYSEAIEVSLTDTRGDYIELSQISGSGPLPEESVIRFPDWLGYRIQVSKKVEVVHQDGQVVLSLVPGMERWHIKVFLSDCGLPVQHRAELVFNDV